MIRFYLSVVNYSDKNKKWSMRSGRAGPRLFLMLSLRGKHLEKGAKEHFGTALWQREALIHVGARSANLPKLSHSRSFKHMERFPHWATQSDSANAASAFHKL